MQLLAELNMLRDGPGAHIQLLQGDLTAIPGEHAADILVISAYPGDYTVPDKKTLMAALYYNGLIVADLAQRKAVDLTGQLHCWLSEPLPPAQQRQFNFNRILCFEPPNREGKEKVVANIFRCINTFAFSDDTNVIIMPVLASGNQKVPMESMMPAILDAAIFWLQNGLPLDCIKLVLHSNEQVQKGLPIFKKACEQYHLWEEANAGHISNSDAWRDYRGDHQQSGSKQEAMPLFDHTMTMLLHDDVQTRGYSSKEKEPHYDFFISYSHKQSSEVKQFVEAMLQHNAGLNIFFDRTSIPAGSLWIRQISDAIQNSDSVICILSPEYSASDVCWDEFQCAKALEYRSKRPVIKTINLYNDTNLPLMMAIYSFVDCTEGDIKKLVACARELL